MAKIKSVSVATKAKKAAGHAAADQALDSVTPHARGRNRNHPRSTQRATGISTLQMLGALYNWGTWIFIMLMVFSQLLGVLWNTVETNQYVHEGRDPSLGPHTLEGSSDEPYTDRVIACVQDGRHYKPVQLNEMISSGKTRVVDATGASISGYRLVNREGLALTSAARDAYSDVCALIATTMDSIFDACSDLGYNVTQDSLRVLDGVDSLTTYLLPDSLPVVVMPFSDNSLRSRFAIPGWDGHSCMFRLLGKYSDKSKSLGVLRGVDRETREAKTVEWLGRAGGEWKNGWYEDREGGKWYSDVISTDQDSIYGVPQRQFDTLKRRELDCINTEDCKDPPRVQDWGTKFSITDRAIAVNSVTISNGNRKGIFLYELRQHRIIKSVYDWETLISNTSLGMLLARWMFAMYALQRGYFKGESKWHNAGIGSLACSRSFNLLPIVLLPRLKITLSAFWSVGCEFGGEQKALSEAWFVVYPAILELMLLQFSLLNIASKVVRRRIPDAPFGPSVVFFCILHWLRMDFADSGSFGIDGRIAPLLTSAQFDNLRLLDFFTTDVSLRLNGNVKGLITIKLVVLGLNVVPLLLTKSSAASRNDTDEGGNLKSMGVEKALAVRVCKVGGLGRSLIYEYGETNGSESAKRGKTNDDVTSNRMGLNSYELVRLGYLVYGGKFLISFEDWEGLTMAAPFRRFYHLWNNRVALFTLRDGSDGDAVGVKAVSEKPHMCRLDDPKMQEIGWWEITGRPVK